MFIPYSLDMKRSATAFILREHGLTYYQIGNQLSISRQRAQQLVKAFIKKYLEEMG
jgi:orotate phosphoribosyltransferase-like protein